MTGTLPPARVGIFGGTFNPIHFGHLRAAEEAAESLSLSRLIFVPSAVPPHKPPQRADPLAKPLDRLDWVRLATSGNPRFAVDALEIEREGPSYMVDTLQEMCPRLAPERPVVVIGRDAFAEIDAWREPAELFRLAHFAVLTRPPERGDDLAAWLPRCVAGEIALDPGGRTGRHRAGTRVCALEITALDISSSSIRERLREGRSIRYLLPDRVREAVERSGIYGAGAGS